MNVITVSAVQTVAAKTYACHPDRMQVRKPNCGFARITLSDGKRSGVKHCGCKRQKVLTHAQGYSGASTKVLKETAALDQLIDLFLGARSQQQVRECVGQLCSTHRIAT